MRAAPRRFVFWLLARARSDWALRIRSLPVLGSIVHACSHRLWPRGRQTPVEVKTGLGKGLRLELDPRYETKLWHGDLEPEVQRRLGELVRPGWVVWDVGASLGFFTLVLARLVGPAGQVVAFEPDPHAAGRLERHARANGFATITIKPVAVWSTPGPLPFGIAADDHGRVHARVGEVDERVEAVTLDGALAELGPPRLVKIDVEGAEGEVLDGAAELLERHGPIVLCEVHLERGLAADRLGRVREILEGHGYGVEQLDPGEDPTHVLARRVMPTA
jgi:FkbM family methyltransferase